MPQVGRTSQARAGLSGPFLPYNEEKENQMADSEIIFSVEESPEGGYEARALRYSIFTQAETIDGLKSMIRDAVACHFPDVKSFRIALRPPR
jgi:hypothetical protein